MTPGIAERLRAAAAALHEGPVSVAQLLQAHGPAACGGLLLVMAVPCLLPIPGTGTVLGLGLLALALALWRGQFDAPLPPQVARLQMPGQWARRVLQTLAWLYAMAARVARPRLTRLLAGPLQRPVAACVGLMALVLVLPIPFGNVLPAASLVLIGLGLVFRDGAALMGGLLASASTLVITVGLLALAGGQLLDWAGRLVS